MKTASLMALDLLTFIVGCFIALMLLNLIKPETMDTNYLSASIAMKLSLIIVLIKLFKGSYK